VASKLVRYRRRHLRIEWCKNLVRRFDESGGHTAVSKVLGNLHADESGADHYRVSGGKHHRVRHALNVLDGAKGQRSLDPGIGGMTGSAPGLRIR